MSNALFSVGTSRGGTTFFTRILSINKEIKMASDPFLPLFRSLRTEIMKQQFDPNFDADLPLDDYYFSEEKLKMMMTIQNSDLKLAFPKNQLETLRLQLISRMNLAAKELVPLVGEIKGDTYYDLFCNGLNILEMAYDASKTTWCGFNDNWIIEFFPLMAKAFPKAKFIIIVRDPRAAIASSMKHREKNPQLVPLVYSFAHHWRKHVDFTIMLMNNLLMKNRLFVFRYEDLVQEPEKKVRQICHFLDVEYDSSMLDTRKFRPIDGNEWKVYSNFKVPSGIYTERIEGWKSFLNKGAIELIEFINEPEMKFMGYQAVEYTAGFPSSEIMRFLLNDHKIALGWRGKHEGWDVEHAYELFRKQVLMIDRELLTLSMIEKNFLFKVVYNMLSSGTKSSILES